MAKGKVTKVYFVRTRYPATDYEMQVAEVVKETAKLYYLAGHIHTDFGYHSRPHKELVSTTPELAIADARSRLDCAVGYQERQLQSARDDLERFDATFKKGESDAT